MPITENNFSEDEFVAAIEANPALLNDVVVKSLTEKKGLNIMTPEQRSTFEKNHENTVIATHTSKFAREMETNLKTLTGIDKLSPDEKYTDYYQRVAKELKGGVDSRTAEIADLKSKTNLSEAERQRLGALELAVTTKDTELVNTKGSYEKQIVQLKAGNKIISEVQPIMNTFFQDERSKAASGVLHEKVVNEMLEMANVDPNTGKVFFTKADGKAMIDTNGNYVTPEGYYSDKMKIFIDSGRKSAGAGGDSGQSGNTGLPADVKTRSELSDFLTKKGLMPGTPAYNVEYNKFVDKVTR